MEKSCSRIECEPIHVKHADLARSDDSMYRSTCPSCGDGMLMVARDHQTFLLLAEDRCILCGQTFVYDDIDKMREREGI